MQLGDHKHKSQHNFYHFHFKYFTQYYPRHLICIYILNAHVFVSSLPTVLHYLSMPSRLLATHSSISSISPIVEVHSLTYHIIASHHLVFNFSVASCLAQKFDQRCVHRDSLCLLAAIELKMLRVIYLCPVQYDFKNKNKVPQSVL